MSSLITLCVNESILCTILIYIFFICKLAYSYRYVFRVHNTHHIKLSISLLNYVLYIDIQILYALHEILYVIRRNNKYKLICAI